MNECSRNGFVMNLSGIFKNPFFENLGSKNVAADNMIRVVVCLLLVFSGSYASADVRVLIEFSGHEHRIVRVINTSQPRYRPPSSLSQSAMRAQNRERRAHRLIVRWYDANGTLLLVEDLRDPRVSHTPDGSGIGETTFERHLFDARTASGKEARTSKQARAVEFADLLSGTYLVTGPAAAATLEIILPAMQIDQHLLAEKRVSWSIKSFREPVR